MKIILKKKNYINLKQWEKLILQNYEYLISGQIPTENFMIRYQEINPLIAKFLSTFEETKEFVELFSDKLNIGQINIEKISKYISELDENLIPKINKLR